MLVVKKFSAAKPKNKVSKIFPPVSYILIPNDMASGPGRNVAQAYARYSAALNSKISCQLDFTDAVKKHRLLAAMERSHLENEKIAIQ